MHIEMLVSFSAESKDCIRTCFNTTIDTFRQMYTQEGKINIWHRIDESLDQPGRFRT